LHISKTFRKKDKEEAYKNERRRKERSNMTRTFSGRLGMDSFISALGIARERVIE
jgi:hypothetical protein